MLFSNMVCLTVALACPIWAAFQSTVPGDAVGIPVGRLADHLGRESEEESNVRNFPYHFRQTSN
jgi:hypothetical protein